MTTPAPLSLAQRVTAALRVLRGGDIPAPPAVPAVPESRAIIPLTYPNFPGLGLENTAGPGAGTAQLSLVRTANPQEFKPEGASIRMEGFGRHPVVNACIRVVSDLVASVPLVVMRARGDLESRVEERHPLQLLLDYPNARFTARQMRARLAVDFLGYGNALLEIDRGGAQGTQGPPRALRSINPESLQSVWVDTDGDARRYDYANWAGIVIYRDVADVIHVRDLDMPRPFAPDVFGFPRGAAALASIAADNEATKYVRQVVTNDGTPTFAVLLADEATQDDASAMQDRYRARVVDRGKRGTPAFFGSVRDIKPLGFTLSDLEFPDLRRVSREDICAVFGVDPRMIGIASATSDAGLSGAQYVEARARLVQHTVEPMMRAIEDELNHWLAPEFGNVWIAFDSEALRDMVEDDTTTSTRVRAEFAASLRTWEESRRALKLSPVPEPTDALGMAAGLKLVPAATAVIDPATVMDAPAPLAEAEEEEEDQSEEDALDEELDDETESERSARAMELPAPVQLPSADPIAPLDIPARVPLEDAEGRPYWVHNPEAARGPVWREDGSPDEDHILFRYWKRSVDLLEKIEPRFEATALALFAAESRAIGRMFNAEDRAQRPATRMDPPDLGTITDPILQEIARRIAADYAPGGEYHAAWREAYLQLIETVYLSGARQVAGVGFSFGMKSEAVLRAIEMRSTRLATLVGETTAKQVTAAIRAGHAGGLSIREIGRLVRASAFGDTMTKDRSELIARTEAAGGMSQGAWDQAQDMGDLFRSKEWLAFTDGKTRPTHLDCMKEGMIPIGRAFKSNGLMYPLDPAGKASQVCNCRCTLGYFTDEVEA